MDISRRTVLKGLATIAATAGWSVPAFSSQRQPYVSQGEVVGHIGATPGFIGGQFVKEVLPWDGVGYPVVTLTNGYPGEPDIYYDVDLCSFEREVPKKFWHAPENNIYPNVHAWVRMKRFGETLEEAMNKQLKI